MKVTSRTGTLRFTTAGSVDDGKSTLIGRLLLDSHAVLEDQMAGIERASRQRGDAYLDLALLTDGLRAEREQAITIDVAYRYFSTPKRKFIIADTPGHIQYTRNMVTGASTAELAVILIDASKGVLTQSKRHGFIASLLQIPHVLVAVNKMDLVDYSREVFDSIVDEYQAFSSQLTLSDISFMPISALKGDNVVEKSSKAPWYEGPTLLHYLENVAPVGGHNPVDFRFPVQLALRGQGGFRGFAGQVASGSIAPGEEVVALPSGQGSRVRAVLAPGGSVESAKAGSSIILTLEDEIDISRGDVIVRRRNLPQTAHQLDCTLCWLAEEPLKLRSTYILQHTTRQVRAYVEELNYRIDVNTLHREKAGTLALNDIGRVKLICTLPLFFDPYQLNRSTGGFILIDPYSNNTVGAGLIRRQAQELEDAGRTETRRSRSSNVTWEARPVTRDLRESRNEHKAAVLWFTGLSGSGKTTIARQLEWRLFSAGVQTFALDGDNVRHGLSGDLGFSAANRRENIRRVAEVAKLAFEHGDVVLCAFISPFRADREFARRLIPPSQFLEIYVKCDLEVLKARDPKGLYARALRGEIDDFTGVSSPFEEPADAELVVETDAKRVDEILDAIWAELMQREIVRKVE